MLVRVAEQRANLDYNMTVGVDCKSRMYVRDGKKIKLQLWDTAGQEKFRNLTTSYYRGTHCCILVFDITNIQSFYNLFKWIDQYNYYCDYDIKNIIIVANKIDLEEKRQVSRLEISKFCESMECDLVEVSVLNDIGIDQLIDQVISKCLVLQEHIDQKKE